MLEVLHQVPPAIEGNPHASRWTLRRIQEQIAPLHTYSLSGSWRWLKQGGLSWRKGRISQCSPDPCYAEKVADLVNCLHWAASDPTQVTVLFMDEMGFWRWATPAPVWCEIAPDPRPVQAVMGNNRQWRILGVLNALTGQVNYLDNYIVGRAVVGKIYPLLETLYPAAQRICLFQDNWSIHAHPDVLAYANLCPRVEIHWLPTYAHWLNPIEKLWRWLRQTVLHWHPYGADWVALLAQVHAFLDQFAPGSEELLRYVGLRGQGLLAQALLP